MLGQRRGWPQLQRVLVRGAPLDARTQAWCVRQYTISAAKCDLWSGGWIDANLGIDSPAVAILGDVL